MIQEIKEFIESELHYVNSRLNYNIQIFDKDHRHIAYLEGYKDCILELLSKIEKIEEENENKKMET